MLFLFFNDIYNKNYIMPLLNDIHSLAIPLPQANLTAHCYTEIYASNNETIILNGLPIALGGGSSIKVKVASVSGASNSTVVLMGEMINNRMDNPTLF